MTTYYSTSNITTTTPTKCDLKQRFPRGLSLLICWPLDALCRNTSLRHRGNLCLKGAFSGEEHRGVSENHVFSPKSSILIGFSIINHPFWGTSIFGDTHRFSCSKMNQLAGGFKDFFEFSTLVSWGRFSPSFDFRIFVPRGWLVETTN